jgi:rsbT co-antagonist protein RsbR
MPCEQCALQRSPRDSSLEAFLDAVSSCDGCPLLHGATAEPLAQALVPRLLAAARELRKLNQRVRRSEADRRDLEASVQRAQEQVATLTDIQKATSREADDLLRQRELALAEKELALLHMSAPVIHVWEGVLVLPLIGTLDAGRAQAMALHLLEEISATRCRSAILDLTGVPTADDATARHLMRVIVAAQLLGSRVILCGLHPLVAGELSALLRDELQVTVVRQLADALQLCGVRPAQAMARQG